MKNLKLNEQKLRDLYLRKLSLGEIQGPPTGYASIDKPWLKYFDEEAIMEEVPKMTCSEYVEHNNLQHKNDIIIDYFGNKITYANFFANRDKASKAFQAIGVKKGDIVTICSVTTPETIYAFYALNQIGAIANFIDVRYSEQAIEKFIDEVDSKYFVTLDICYPKLTKIINKLEKIIFISPTNSAPKLIQLLNKTANSLKRKTTRLPSNKKILTWNEFIKNGHSTKLKTISYEKDLPAVIIHTGGTTGTPKGAILSNDNFLAAAIQIKNSNAEITRGDIFLNIMPPFIAYGIVLGINAPMSFGWKIKIIPQFNPDKFDDLLIKHKPNAVMGVPAYWETVMNSSKMKKKDLSYIKVVLLGGDKTKPEFEKRLQKFLKEKGSSSDVGKGYSMTEASACATFSSKKSNKLDSVGVPLTKTTIAAFKPNTKEELSIGEIGEICIKTPTMMLNYYDNPKMTEEVIWKHDDGVWVHSGDIGYVDKDGLVFIKDRIKRMIVRSGFKVFPSELENLFLQNEAIESCAVVGIPDKVDVNAPKAYLVLKEQYKEYEAIIKEELIKSFRTSELPPYFEPVAYEFRNSLPLTNIGKIDFMALQKENIALDKKILKRTLNERN